MDRIETGTILQRLEDGTEEKTYEMIFLDHTHLDQVMALQEVIYDTIDNREKFVPDPREFYDEIALTEGRGKMIGVFVEGEMIAARSISFPGLSYENLAWDLNLPEEEMLRVCHLEASMVRPDYRGNRLQGLMMRPTLKYARQRGCGMVLCTVSPYNYPSLKNVMEAGLLVRDVKVREGVYGGKLRFLLAMNLRRQVEPVFLESCAVMNTVIEVQKGLLEAGYVGYRLEKVPGELPGGMPYFIMRYGKPYPALMGRLDATLLSTN